MGKLKPCPFCGGKAIFRTISNTSDNYSVGFAFEIKCEDCGMKSPSKFNVNFGLTEDGEINVLNDRRYDAISRWNNRI